MSSTGSAVEQFTILVSENPNKPVNSSKQKRSKWSIFILLLLIVLFIIWIARTEITASVTSYALTGKNATTEKSTGSNEFSGVDRIVEGIGIVKNDGENSYAGECEEFSCRLWPKIVQPKITDILERDIDDDDILPITQAKIIYRKCLHGGDHEKRKFLCSSYVESHFKIALLHKFVLQNYKNEQQFITVKNQASEIFTDVKRQYDRFDSAIFLSQAKNTTVCVGAPEWIFNRSKVEEVYKKLSVHHNQSFLEQLIEIDHWSSTNQFDDESECEWTDSPDLAYVAQKDNCIYISLGMLQPPYFYSNQTKAINYGALGAMVGRELAKAYMSPDWQTSKDSPAHCLKKQYSSISPGVFRSAKIGSNADSKLSMFFADNLGLQAAYDAFSRNIHQQQISEPARLTEYKMFFRGFKQASCSKTGAELNGILKNSMLGELYDCPEGSYMSYSSQHTCSLEFKKKSIKKDLSQQFP